MHNDRRGIYLTVLVAVITIGVVAFLIHYDNQSGIVLTEEEKIVELTENHKFAQLAVNLIIDRYDNSDKELGELDDFLKMNFNSKHKRYAFVMDYDTQKIVAHPNTERIGADSVGLMNSTESTELILENLKINEGYWVHYDFENPETGNVEPKTSWFKLHDGLIFGSGFYD